MSLATATHRMVLRGVRAWLKACAKSSGTLTDTQVIPSDDDGPRPPLPYLTVKLTSVDVVVGQDERVDTVGAQVTVDGGAEGDVYTLSVGDVVVTYTRTADDTDETVATALATAANAASDHVWAQASGAALVVGSMHGELVVASSDPNLTVTADEVPLVGVLGQRSATLSVQAFGAEAGDWLERATMRLSQPAAQTILDDAGLTVMPISGVTNLAAVVDTSIEARWLREFDVSYAIRVEPETAVSFGHSDVTMTLESYSTDPDPYTTSIVLEE